MNAEQYDDLTEQLTTANATIAELTRQRRELLAGCVYAVDSFTTPEDAIARLFAAIAACKPS